MDLKGVKERDHFIDLENGASDSEGTVDSLDSSSTFVERAFDNGRGLLDERFGRGEKAGIKTSREKTRRKASKPPLLPKPPCVVVADQEMAGEKPDHTMLKRARLERMKAFMKKKNGKVTSSNVYIGAWVITIIFCAIIIWHGVFLKGRSSGSLHGSLESSLGSSVELHGNLLANPHHPRFGSPEISISGVYLGCVGIFVTCIDLILVSQRAT